MGNLYNSKGGRTAALPMRVTPEEKALISAAAKALGLSVSDFVLMLTKQHLEAKGTSND